MTDYLLVHGAGQGAWSWGKVWGYMTAPVEHPPRLYAQRKVGKVFSMDLPGHGSDSDGDTSSVLMDECVQSIIRTVERQGLHNLIVVGHGFAGSLILQAASQLPEPPKRLILLAGIVPDGGKSMVSELPYLFRRGFQGITNVTGLFGKDVETPREVISRYMCNGMEPMELVQFIGYFGPLPVTVLKSKTPDQLDTPCPVTYIVLIQDRLIPPAAQRKMAQRIPDVEIMELDSCHQAMLFRPRELADLLLSFA